MSGLPTSTGRPRGRPRKNPGPIFPGILPSRGLQSSGTSQPSPAQSVDVSHPMPDSPLAGNRRALSPMHPWNPDMKDPFEEKKDAQSQYNRDFKVLCQTVVENVAVGEVGDLLHSQIVNLVASNLRVNIADLAIHEGLTDRIVKRNQQIEQLNQELLEAKVEIVNLNEAMASIHHAAASKKKRRVYYDNSDDDDDNANDDDAPGDDASLFPADQFGDQSNSHGVMSENPGDYFEMGDGSANMSGAGGFYEEGESFDAPAPVDDDLSGPFVVHPSSTSTNLPLDPALGGNFNPRVDSSTNFPLDPALGGNYNPRVDSSTNFPLDPALGGTSAPSVDPPFVIPSHYLGNVYGNPAGNYPIQSSPDNYEALRNLPAQANFSGNSQVQFSNFSSSGNVGVPNMNNQMNMGYMPYVNSAGQGDHGGMLATHSTSNPPRIRFAKGESKRPFVYPNGNVSEQKRQRVKQRCDHCYIQHSRCPQDTPFAPCGTCVAANIECRYTNIGRGTDNPRRKGDDDQGSPRTKRPRGSLGLLPMTPVGDSSKRTEYSG